MLVNFHAPTAKEIEENAIDKLRQIINFSSNLSRLGLSRKLYEPNVVENFIIALEELEQLKNSPSNETSAQLHPVVNKITSVLNDLILLTPRQKKLKTQIEKYNKKYNSTADEILKKQPQKQSIPLKQPANSKQIVKTFEEELSEMQPLAKELSESQKLPKSLSVEKQWDYGIIGLKEIHHIKQILYILN